MEVCDDDDDDDGGLSEEQSCFNSCQKDAEYDREAEECKELEFGCDKNQCMYGAYKDKHRWRARCHMRCDWYIPGVQIEYCKGTCYEDVVAKVCDGGIGDLAGCLAAC